MLIDQLKIAEGSTVVNLSFPSGTTFPTSVQAGEVFYRTDEKQAYIYNGTDWDKVTDVSASQLKTYDIGLTCPGEIEPSTTLLFFVAAREIIIPANFSGSSAAVGTILSPVTLSIKRNNSVIGSIIFTSTGTATFSALISGNIILAPHDSLSISSPPGAMPTDLAVTIQAVIDGAPPVIDTTEASTSKVTSVSVTSSDMNVTGSPITSSGVIDLTLKSTAVTPGSYTYSNITVDSKGRLTAASSGTPVTSFNTRTGAVSLTASDIVSVLGIVPTDNEGTVKSVGLTSTDFAVSGSPITASGTIVANLNTTAVTPGSYTFGSFTVDSKGRLTAASSGTPVTSFNTRTGAVTLTSADVTTALGYTPGTVTSVGLTSTDFSVSGSPITASGLITANLNTTTVTAGSYTFGSFTVDSKGRLSAASSGVPVTSFNTRTGDVSLTSADVTTALGYTPGQGAMTTLTLSGGTTGLTGGVATGTAQQSSTTITLAGTLAVKNGGTGGTTATAALTNLLPTQTGNTGKALTTNGTSTQWTAMPSGTVTSVELTSTDLDIVNPIVTSSGTISATLKTVNLAPGAFAYASIIVDSKGLVTSAEANTPVTSFNTRTGAVSLTLADITATLGFTPGTVTSVALSGGTTGLTTSGGPITSSGTITLGGTLSVANGGTGGTTATAALTNLLPTQTGNTGKALTTNGTSTQWTALPSGTVTSVGLTSTDFAVSGSPITASGTIVANLNTTTVTPGSYTYSNITVDSKGRLTAAFSGTPVTSFNTRTGAVTLTPADVTTALGYTPGSGSGTVTSVALSGGTTGLTTSGGPVTTSGTITLAGTLAVANGGTGGTTAAAALTNLLPAQTGNTGKVLTTNGTAASWASPTTGTVTSVAMSSTDFAVSGSPITASGAIVANLNTTAVTAGSYTFGSFTVDSKGRLTAASSGTPVTSFNTRTGAVTLSVTDITGALGFTPFSSASGLGTISDVSLTSPTAGQALVYDSVTTTWKNTTLTSDLPSQTGNTGKLLTTDGTNASWGNTLSQLAVGASTAVLPSPVSLPLQSVSTSSAGLTIGKFSADNGGGYISFAKSRSATPGTYSAALLSGDSLGSIQTFGDDGSSTLSSSQGSGIAFTTSENWSSTAHGSDIRFYTTANTTLTKTERMRITQDGRLAIGTTSPGAAGISSNVALTGSTTAMGVRVNATVLQDVTTVAYGFRSTLNTEAAAFTLGSLIHYVAEGPATPGAGSTITTQVGYSVPSGLTAATTNIGFNGNIAYNAAKANWNFYAGADAWNYFAGITGVGSTPALGQLFRVGGTGKITGATTAYSVLNNATVNSDVTSTAVGYSSHITTTSNAFTVNNITHFNASPNTLGVGSTINYQYGFNANSNLTSATVNYGFFGNIPSGTGRWNFYALGTAQNYFNGTTTIGSDVSTVAATSAQKLQVHTGSGAGAALFRWAADNGGAALRLVKSRSTTMGTFGTAPLAGDSLGEISFIGDNTTGTNVVNSAISSAAVEDFTATANGTNLRFNTTPTGSATPAERVRINSTGNVLIGTTTDDGVNKLQVSGAIVGTKVSTGAISGASIFAGTTDVTPDYPVLVSKAGTSTTTTGVALGSNNADRSSVLFTMLNTASTHLTMSRIVGLNSSATAGAEKGYLVFDTKGAADASPVGRLTLSEISASFAVPVQVTGGISLTGALSVGASPSAGTSGQVLVSGGTGAAPSWKSIPPAKITAVTASTSSVTVDFTNSDTVRLTLNASVTSLTITGATDGQKCLLEIIQDATGSRTITWPANVRFGTDITSIVLTATAGKTDRVGFIYVSGANKYDVVSLVRGF